MCHKMFRYMAPEVLSSEVLPASDVWSAGVMTYQLLTGQFPFDDKQNPFKPSVAKIWSVDCLCQLQSLHRHTVVVAQANTRCLLGLILQGFHFVEQSQLQQKLLGRHQ